ncbi:MAG: hypothetical protein IJH21_05080, partial [Oscillospiraceae bacterium]|nr:hypothetical protein [Oscillospiraceae bacterium]
MRIHTCGEERAPVVIMLPGSFCNADTMMNIIMGLEAEFHMPRGGRFYKLSMHVYLAVAGGAVHLPCGAFMWIYKSVAGAAGKAVGHDIAMKYLLYFLLPAAAVFAVFFIGAGIVQFVAFFKGRTPFPKWYCVFNLLLGKAVFNGVRRLGNTALINGIGTSNMSLGAIVMFAALLLGWKRYVGNREYVL